MLSQVIKIKTKTKAVAFPSPALAVLHGLGQAWLIMSTMPRKRNNVRTCLTKTLAMPIVVSGANKIN